MESMGKSDIPVVRGGSSQAAVNEAAKFMVKTVKQYPGEVAIIATGSLTNLYHAWCIDNTFYDKVPEISLMGGIVEPLIIQNKLLNELNFSCNYEAAHNVLTHGKIITIATGNQCLAALFEKSRFDQLRHSEDQFLIWLHREAAYWFDREKSVFGHDGIYKWDVYAVAALLNPSFLQEEIREITPDLESLQTGLLLGKGESRFVNMPRLVDSAQYEEHVYQMYIEFARSRND